MHPLERKIDRLSQTHALFTRGQTVVVGVSAGPDSVALLHLLASLGQKWSLRLVAVYVDHGLRPAETRAEAELVRQAAARLGAGFATVAVDVRTAARAQGLSLEHAGRLLRYRVFERLAGAEGVARIAVAHTADEQAEEILLRLIRGTGRAGLAGMAMLRDGRVVRPLLTTAKDELLAYLGDRGIAFCTDSSNRDRRYLRNRVRLDLLPFLARDFNPNIGENLRYTAAILRDEEAYLGEVTEAAWQEVAVPATAGETEEEELSLRLEPLLAQPVAIRRRLLERACWQWDEAPSFRRIEQLLRLAEEGRPGRLLHLGSGLRVARRADRLVFSRPRGKKPLRGDLLGAAPCSFVLAVAAPGRFPLPELGRRLVVEVSEVMSPLPPPAGEEWLDGDRITFPLVVRSPRAGDRFWPLGAPGGKKVGDFLTDCKVPREQRWRVPVLESEGTVVALLGLRIGHGARLTSRTRRLVKIRLEPL